MNDFINNLTTSLSTIDPNIGIGVGGGLILVLIGTIIYRKKQSKPVITFTEPVSKKTENLDDLMVKINNEAKEDEREDLDNFEDSESEAKEKFKAAFVEMASDLKAETDRTAPRSKDISIPENQTVWANWMLHISGKASMKKSFILIEGQWGTQLSIIQLDNALSKEAHDYAGDNPCSWAVLSITPLID